MGLVAHAEPAAMCTSHGKHYVPATRIENSSFISSFSKEIHHSTPWHVDGLQTHLLSSVEPNQSRGCAQIPQTRPNTVETNTTATCMQLMTISAWWCSNKFTASLYMPARAAALVWVRAFVNADDTLLFQICKLMLLAHCWLDGWAAQLCEGGTSVRRCVCVCLVFFCYSVAYFMPFTYVKCNSFQEVAEVSLITQRWLNCQSPPTNATQISVQL